MKLVHVSAALIFRTLPSGTRQIFATQRGYGEWRGWWEFPGGKIEARESPQTALKREIREELDTEIRVGSHIATINYDYPAFHLHMDCFACEVVSSSLTLLEHESAAWLTARTLRTVRWLPADEIILDKVALFLQSRDSETMR
ncbi:MAG: (deoxy)nucleoside triphosphate pyrophosphohydrolase [Treponema sp.]|nr:(deoxy)nucleoside triphosphate pyrophosphohydrolase [Treponema sp.]